MKKPLVIKKTSELIIGDVVKLVESDGNINESSANQEMTVIQKNEREVTFFRPYVHLGDFVYTGGVIPYTGIEKFSVPADWHTRYLLIENIYRCKCQGKHDDDCPKKWNK